LTDEIINMAGKKISDYSLKRETFIEDFNKQLAVLDKRGTDILRGEMERFLPLAYRQAFKNSWPDICNDTALILKKAITGLSK